MVTVSLELYEKDIEFSPPLSSRSSLSSVPERIKQFLEGFVSLSKSLHSRLYPQSTQVRQRQRERQRERERQRQRQRETEREEERERQRDRERERERKRQRDRETEKETERERGILL